MARWISRPVILFAPMMLSAGLSAAEEPTARERVILPVARSSQERLAKMLSDQFSGETVVSLPPEEYGPCLVVSASPAIVKSMMELMRNLEETEKARLKERLLRIEIAEFRGEGPMGVENPSHPEAVPQLAEFNRPYTEVRAAIRARHNQLVGIRQLELRIRDEQPAVAQLGETIPFVRGVTMSAGGRSNPMFTMDNVGFIARATSRIGEDGRAIVVLSIEESRPESESDGTPLMPTEKSSPVMQCKEVFMAQTTATMTPGETQAIAVWNSAKKKEPTHRIVLVTLDPPAPVPRNSAPQPPSFRGRTGSIPTTPRTNERPSDSKPDGNPPAAANPASSFKGGSFQEQALARMFKNLDTDGDGQLQKSEWEARDRTVRFPPPAYFDALESKLSFPTTLDDFQKTARTVPMSSGPIRKSSE